MHLPLLISALPLLQDAWTPRPLPSVCHATPSVEAPYELLDADHLPFPGRLPGPPDEARAPVPVSVFLQLVDEALRRRDERANLEVAGDLLLVQGDSTAKATVEGVLSDLFWLEAQLRIPWQVQLTVADGAPLTWRGLSRSGERTTLGERRAVAYLGYQDVNVASDSGVAEPETHHALLGATIHLTCSNLQGGDRLIEGCLDLAELVSLAKFDPGTPDLGMLQLPEVASAQVRFAARNEARVTLTGLPEPLGSVSLVVSTTKIESEKGSGPWRAYDLAALTQHPPRALPVLPGGLGVTPPAGRHEPLPVHDPGALAGLLDANGLEPSAPLWSGSLLLVQSGSNADATAERLIPALEAYMVEGNLSVSSGALQATFPVVGGREARLVVGLERRRATEVGSQLAPSTWMPIVEVERTFDGLVLQGIPRGDGLFHGSLRESSGKILDEILEPDSGLASFQLLERRRRGSSVELSGLADQDKILLPETATGPAVLARFRQR